MTLAGWTPERVETLRALHAEGKSAGDIAAILGDTSRNAVIGKKSRLGLVSNRPPEVRTSPVKRIRKPQNRVSAITHAPRWHANVPPMLCEPVEEETELVLNEIVSFTELQPHHCRWPIGQRDYVFCGGTKAEGSPYCIGHSRIAYRPGG
jgi:GcrA cell cycle regulator